jgi:hypothetical protein
VLKLDATPFYERYYRVQQALGHAIRQVHPHRTDVPNPTLQTIRAELETYEWCGAPPKVGGTPRFGDR